MKENYTFHMNTMSFFFKDRNIMSEIHFPPFCDTAALHGT